MIVRFDVGKENRTPASVAASFGEGRNKLLLKEEEEPREILSLYFFHEQ